MNRITVASNLQIIRLEMQQLQSEMATTYLAEMMHTSERSFWGVFGVVRGHLCVSFSWEFEGVGLLEGSRCHVT
jgi:hypothetical protein